mmetsp:Transcript_114501/g.227874  ORF Transcript_114501/g.227874 Transcript_114501/m.227874 type:complete len:464 (+) Transcript_114501:27-1418(+)
MLCIDGCRGDAKLATVAAQPQSSSVRPERRKLSLFTPANYRYLSSKGQLVIYLLFPKLLHIPPCCPSARAIKARGFLPDLRSCSSCGDVTCCRRGVPFVLVSQQSLQSGFHGAVSPWLHDVALPLLCPRCWAPTQEEPRVGLCCPSTPSIAAQSRPPPGTLPKQELLPAVLKEASRHLWWALLLVAWKAKEVDCWHSQELCIGEKVRVVLHAWWGYEQLPRAGILEEGNRVGRRHEAVLLPMDKKRGTRNIAYEGDVGKSLVEHVGNDTAHKRFCRLADRGEGSHKNEAANREPACQVDCRTRTDTSAKEDYLLIRNFQVVQDETECCKCNLLEGSLTDRNAMQQAIAWVLDSEHIHFELVTHVLHKRKTHPKVFCVTVAKKDYPGCTRCRQPQAWDAFRKPLVIHAVRRDGLIPGDPTKVLFEGLPAVCGRRRRKHEPINERRHAQPHYAYLPATGKASVRS